MDVTQRFHDRREAGQLLARQLTEYKDHGDVFVLALPRGGGPAACEMARELNAPIDVFVVSNVVTTYSIPPHVIHTVVERDKIAPRRRLEGYRGTTDEEVRELPNHATTTVCGRHFRQESSDCSHRIRPSASTWAAFT